MLPESFEGSIALELLFAVAVTAIALVLALFVHPLVSRTAKMIVGHTKTTLDDVIVEAVIRPIKALVLLQGLYIGLSATLFVDKLWADWQDFLTKSWIVLMLALVFYTLLRVVHALIGWYGAEVASKTASKMDDKLPPLLRRLSTIAIYAIGVLVILNNLGIQLGPVLTGLGIGGLAVALALQPTLSNFFAGAFVVADGAVGVGDFIDIPGVVSGTVQDVGLRTTKILTPTGNLVTIPNSKLVDNAIINFAAPTPELGVAIPCGVSYESDLERVEAVCIEVAQQVIDEQPATVAVKSFTPVVRFAGFGDSNINFNVIVRAADRGGSFLLTHEIIKRLHARFAKEGIEMNYPVRKVIYPKDASTNGTHPEPAYSGAEQPRLG